MAALSPALNGVLVSDAEALAVALFTAYETGSSTFNAALPAESFAALGKTVTLTPAALSIAISIK